jgi:hypothetical protein
MLQGIARSVDKLHRARADDFLGIPSLRVGAHRNCMFKDQYKNRIALILCGCFAIARRPKMDFLPKAAPRHDLGGYLPQATRGVIHGLQRAGGDGCMADLWKCSELDISAFLTASLPASADSCAHDQQ